MTSRFRVCKTTLAVATVLAGLLSGTLSQAQGPGGALVRGEDGRAAVDR